MIRFFLSFILLYGGIHAYAFIRLYRTFTLNRSSAYSLAGIMVGFTFTPLLVRLAESSNRDTAALWLAWPGYIWMGAIFIFCSLLFVIDFLRGIYQLVIMRGKTSRQLSTASISCKIALLATVAVSIYALYEARHIRTDYLKIESSKLPPASTGIRVVQISDVHLGLLFRESRLESLLETVKKAHPDLLVSTGDIMDGRLSREEMSGRFERMAAMIAAVPTSAGKFACLGNHEYYAGVDQAVQYTQKAGFTVLRNQSASLSQGITVTGIEDPARKRLGLPEAVPTESELMASNLNKDFQLLLKHRPQVSASSDGRFDLQLSGHVHQGQIFPFNILVRLQFPIPCGTTTTPGNSKIHVSRGSGTWGPPMRLLAPPEVTVIDIVPATPPLQN